MSCSPNRWIVSVATRETPPPSSSLTFAGVNIVTLAEGDITHLHIGFKGTMNAPCLKDLRGLVEAIVLTPDQAGQTLQSEFEGESGGDAGDRTNEEVAGIRRPLLANIFGCGGGI